MNGVDSLGSNQKCRIGYKNSHNCVSQCLASIRKLGNHRSSAELRTLNGNKFVYSYHSGWGYRNEPRSKVSMSPFAKNIARHQTRSLNVRTVKSAFMHHAPNVKMMNSWNQTMDLGIVQTAKLTVVYAVVLY